jgi:hypothetical protein
MAGRGRPRNLVNNFSRANRALEGGISVLNSRFDFRDGRFDRDRFDRFDDDRFKIFKKLFDRYPVGTELAVAWEGGGAIGNLCDIEDGIVTLGGPGFIFLGNIPIPFPHNSFIKILLKELIAVVPVDGSCTRHFGSS